MISGAEDATLPIELAKAGADLVRRQANASFHCEASAERRQAPSRTLGLRQKRTMPPQAATSARQVLAYSTEHVG